MMYAIIGIAIGILVNQLIIKPLECKRIRRECVRNGLIPWCMK